MMKHFYQKPYKVPPATIDSQTSAKKSKTKVEKVPTTTRKPLADMDKKGLVHSMAWYHPTSTLDVGTLAANIKRVFASRPETTTLISTTSALDRPDVQQQVMKYIQEATQLAAGVKRKAQRLIGQFVETLRDMMNEKEETLRVMLHSENKTMSEAERIRVRKRAISDNERKILDYLCDRIKPMDENGDEADSQKKASEDNSDIDDKGTNQVKFLLSFLTCLYSGNYPNANARIGVPVNIFIDWLVDHKFYDPPRTRGDVNATMPFTPNYLIRSVSGQVAAELQRMYASGTYELYKKVKTMKEKGTLGLNDDIGIHDDISAVENFLFLNKLTNNSRRIIPLTSSKQPFVSFSERELATFFGSVMY
ncbi:hypothetical protein BGZ98_005234 [Dissophora globulifera]|nr:hypothetical protein BGZ98_005234 [Dissophora globulifera]